MTKETKSAATPAAQEGAELLDARVLERLFAVIDSRHGADPSTSYTAKLFAAGAPKIAQKLGEEATETVIAALVQDEQALADESADLLYHLLALWSVKGLDPQAVWRALDKRVGTSGIDEKKARKKQA